MYYVKRNLSGMRGGFDPLNLLAPGIPELLKLSKGDKKKSGSSDAAAKTQKMLEEQAQNQQTQNQQLQQAQKKQSSMMTIGFAALGVLVVGGLVFFMATRKKD